MRVLLQLVSFIALAGVIVPPLLFLMGKLDLDRTKMLMLVATIGWFAITPLWMGRPTQENPGETSE